MNILIIITTLFLLITKYFDVITTYKVIRKQGNSIEKNIIVRALFNKFGLNKGLFIVSLIYIAIVSIALYEVYNGDNSIKITYLILSFIIGIIQIFVAINNTK